MFTAQKTVADCFKYRYKIGVGLAEKALHRALREPSFHADTLLKFAQLCRVEKVVRRALDTGQAARSSQRSR